MSTSDSHIGVFLENNEELFPEFSAEDFHEANIRLEVNPLPAFGENDSSSATQSPHSNSSPNEIPTKIQSPSQSGFQPLTAPFEATLMHKPRGSQGNWQPVEPNEGIRVTKGKGKKLKIRVRSRYNFDTKALEIVLSDKSSNTENPFVTTEGFTTELISKLETSVDQTFVCEIEIKLSRYCKRVAFTISAPILEGILQASTVDFCSHNNGKMAKNESSTNLSSTSLKKQKVATPPNLNQPTLETTTQMNPPLNPPQPTIHTHVVPGNLEVHGVVKAQAFAQFSDLRLKTNIEDIVDAISIVSQLEGKSYEWKKGTILVDDKNRSGGERVLGLIAQEVQKVLPEVVHEDPTTGLLSVSYIELIPILIEAFKAHTRNYEKDKKDVAFQLGALSQKVSSLEAQTKKHTPRTAQLVQFLQQSPVTPVIIVGPHQVNFVPLLQSQVVETPKPQVDPQVEILRSKHKQRNLYHWSLALCILGLILVILGLVLQYVVAVRAGRITIVAIFLAVLGPLLFVTGIILLIVQLRRKRKGNVESV